MKVAVCCTGLKGYQLLNRADNTDVIHSIYSYKSGSEGEEYYEKIKQITSSLRKDFICKRHPSREELSHFDLVILVGWGFMLELDPQKSIIIHDSLLPRYRGFAPTACALMKGEKQIGATAIYASPKMDYGNIICQASWDVEYPIKIGTALAKQGEIIARIFDSIVEDWKSCRPSGQPQNHDQATYSHWRDLEDCWVDWNWSAESIRRFVDALDRPYPLARTMYQNQVLLIHDVEIVSDVVLEIRQPGKIFSIESGIPTVVCGSGMLKLVDARVNGAPFFANKLKVRMRRGNVQ